MAGPSVRRIAQRSKNTMEKPKKGEIGWREGRAEEEARSHRVCYLTQLPPLSGWH